jgi:hypothetical protein
MIRGASRQFVVNVRLYFRNPLALGYGYLFPTLFLLAYWGLYRYDRVPLMRHMGELLTVTVLGGACFGLPTSIVSERERGVWRRYRLMPVPVSALVISTMASRYVLVVTAGLLQLALAMVIGMPRPEHLIQLWLAFTVVAFAFLGCGLVIAMMADTVPAVQALGQTIFLPMLIIGGIAVPIASLPEWAQHASAFFPGRYAVESLQACVAGEGVRSTRFAVLALLIVGAAGCTAGAKMFRWDERERFAARHERAWVAVALAAWAAVGVMAESRGHITVPRAFTPSPYQLHVDIGNTPASRAVAVEALRATPAELAAGAKPTPVSPQSPTRVLPKTVPAPSRLYPSTWQAVKTWDVDADLRFDQLPPDGGIITPIASSSEELDPSTRESLADVARALPDWPPGSVSDPVQRARNLLYVAAVPDLLQIDLERYVPAIVFDRLENGMNKDDLIKVLYWIAVHPFDGDDQAVGDMSSLGFPQPPTSKEELHARAAVYGVKLLGRLLGQIESK